MSLFTTTAARQSLVGSLRFCVAFWVCLLIFYGDGIAETRTVTERIADSLEGDWGQLKFNLRYRYEQVDQEDLETAKGDPLRLRVGYLTPQYKGLQGYLEGLVNTTVFVDDFNDTVSGEKTEYAAIPDPNDEEINQAWLSWNTVGNTNLKGGRQKIAYDNQRFVSWCAFRQLEQTFDSVTLLNKTIGNLDLKAAYVWNVLNVKNQEAGMQTPLINISYLFPGLGTLSGYGYWLDYSDEDNSGTFPFAYSSMTYGLRFAGKADLSDTLNLLYEAEYANQSDYGDNPESFSADYYHLVGGLAFPLEGSLVNGITAKVGYELLGSDNGVPFQTPLGANHKFNGWADIFGINKPENGLRDFYASIMANVGPLNLDFRFHDFSADEGGSNYGSEFDFKLAWKFKKHYTLAAIYASYDADEYKTDTDKLWLELTVDF
jgi:hypothetical protein